MFWAGKQDVRIEYIQPDKPQQNVYIERYNGHCTRADRIDYMNCFGELLRRFDATCLW